MAERMRNFLQDPARDVEEPYFTLSEFLDYFFDIVHSICSWIVSSNSNYTNFRKNESYDMED